MNLVKHSVNIILKTLDALFFKVWNKTKMVTFPLLFNMVLEVLACTVAIVCLKQIPQTPRAFPSSDPLFTMQLASGGQNRSVHLPWLVKTFPYHGICHGWICTHASPSNSHDAGQLNQLTSPSFSFPCCKMGISVVRVTSITMCRC